MENPVYHKAMHFFQRMGHTVLSFPMDSQGMQVTPLEPSGTVNLAHFVQMGFKMAGKNKFVEYSLFKAGHCRLKRKVLFQIDI